MATTGPVEGTLYKITVGGTSIDSQTSASFEFTTETRDVTTKDSSGWMEKSATLKSVSFSVDILVALDDTYALEELYDAWVAGTAVTVVFTTSVTGDVQWSCDCILTSGSVDAPQYDNVTGSFSFESTGAVTKSDVSS